MKKLSFIIIIGLLPFLCFSQKPSVTKNAPQEEPFITLEYMHVKPGNEDAYLQVENTWRKIHQVRAKKGIIEGWSVWQVVAPYNIDAPYQYVVLTVYPKFSNFLNPNDGIHLRDVFPGVSDDSLNKILEATGKVRDLVKRDIFYPNDHVGNPNGDSIKYLMATYVEVTPENEKSFHSFMKEHWTPVIEKVVKGGFAKFWWLGSKQFGAEAPYNHIMVANWSRENFFDDTPPFDQYRKEDPAAFEGYKFYSGGHRELLQKMMSLNNGLK